MHIKDTDILKTGSLLKNDSAIQRHLMEKEKNLDAGKSGKVRRAIAEQLLAGLAWCG